MENKLLTVEGEEPCIACCDGTTMRAFCCKAPLCKACYLEWLKRKRQCMHCKADQCEFSEWVENYRQDVELYDEEEPEIEIIEIALNNTNDVLNMLTDYTIVNLNGENLENLIENIRAYNELFQAYLDLQS